MNTTPTLKEKVMEKIAYYKKNPAELRALMEYKMMRHELIREDRIKNPQNWHEVQLPTHTRE